MTHYGSVFGSLAALCRQSRFWLVALASVLLLLVMPVRVALGAPVAPEKVQLTQPDGTSFIATPFGDEWYSGYEHMGYTILLDTKTAYWKYAEQVADGSLVPGELRVGIDPLPANLPRHLRDRIAISHAPATAAAHLPEAWPGVSGSQRVLIILADFTPSESLGTTDAQWNNAFFNNTPGAKSIKNFYEEASYGQFTLDPVVETYGTANDGVIAVTLGYAHPDPYPTDDNNRQIVYDALVAADPFIDYSVLDTSGNSALDVTELHLFVICRGFEKSYGGTANSCSPSVWGHRWSLWGTVAAPTLDGVLVADSASGGGYTQEGEWHEYTGSGCTGTTGQMATIGIMCHELGHDISWPDLYDTDDSSEGVGYWSVMGTGSWGYASGEPSGTTPILPDAFLKWYQGWLTPTQLTAPVAGVAIPNSAQNATVYQLGNNTNGVDWEYRVSSGTGDYFLIENRQQVGFDAGLFRISSSAAGCIIWHIDESRPFDNTANADETHKLVDVEEADGTPQDLDSPLGGGGNRGDTGDPWPGSTSNTTFNNSSDPNSNWYTGFPSNINVTNISTAGTGCTCDFNQVPTAVTLASFVAVPNGGGMLMGLVGVGMLVGTGVAVGFRRRNR